MGSRNRGNGMRDLPPVAQMARVKRLNTVPCSILDAILEVFLSLISTHTLDKLFA